MLTEHLFVLSEKSELLRGKTLLFWLTWCRMPHVSQSVQNTRVMNESEEADFAPKIGCHGNIP